jgi:predicted nucleotidyltransferase
MRSQSKEQIKNIPDKFRVILSRGLSGGYSEQTDSIWFWSSPDEPKSSDILKLDRNDALAILRQSEPALRARGVCRAALFGSVARGDNRPDSDIDVMVEIDPAAHVGVYEYVALKEYIESLFAGRVDVVSRDALKPYVRPAATADAVYAF